MIQTKNFEPKNNNFCIGYKSEFNFFKNLLLKNKFPKVLLLTGKKGIGKFTLVNHLMHYYFDRKNYDEDKNIFGRSSSFHYNFSNNLFTNILHLNGSSFSNIKIEDIRKLKSNLSFSSINKDKRFIILDDVEIFNINSLNALLKLIEEPTSNNFFILINNKSKKLLDTIKSRSIEININLNEERRLNIISTLINIFDQKQIFDKNLVKISPGFFIKFNHFFEEKKLCINDNFLLNLKTLLGYYRKDKDSFYKDLILFITEYHLQNKRIENINFNIKFIEKRSSIINYLNDFFLYNLSQNTLLNAIEGKLK